MLFRFCNVCCNNLNSTFVTTLRRYARAAAKSRKKEKALPIESTETRNEELKVISCKRKDFNFYKGTTYPKRGVIPLASDGWLHRKSRGDYFYILPYDNESEKDTDKRLENKTFDDFNLDPSICSQFEKFDIKKPLEVQQLGIPKILNRNNALLTAETGCGKTLAYLLPLMHRILQWKQIIQKPMNQPFAIILTPTRELAVQIAIESIKWSKELGIKVRMITGGRTKRKIRNPQIEYVDILVGSFGVISKLFTVGVYKPDLVRCLILDEVDALCHYTFEDKVKHFLNKFPIAHHQQLGDDGFPSTVQLVLASATVPSRLANILAGIVDVNSLEHVSTKKLHRILVKQKFIRMGPSDKPAELLKYIKPKVAKKHSVIIFSNTSATSYWLTLFLKECGIETTNLHGDMPLSQRIGKYGSFLNRKTYVLSATNAGSRGLDTVMVNHILNYDFPLDTASYIHRCGRTGRVGTIGNCMVTNFISKPAEVAIVKTLERAARRLKPIPVFDTLHQKEDEEEMMTPEPHYPERIVESLDDPNDIPF
ncbi:putative ATP-dependent RNA helicase Dbp21E2 [Nomia melanderi]|uniref:putative ATP-dependent RNA helicase Dbp21E2 n=1 Tax=Nomia melanderi TaxID=2448451 RepID=UPI0013043BED|nr:probable ATP-dependent RNA helicase DDX28 [Nomia melanderi]